MKPFSKLLAAALTAGVLIHCSAAAEVPRVDLRANNENLRQTITFSAESEGVGHAFIVWQKEDDQKKMTTREVLGFYPDKDKSVIDFGKPGQIMDDKRTKAEFAFIVDVDAEHYDKALRVLERWRSAGNYTLGFSDCTTFVGEVASAIGLNTPLRAFAPRPLEYVQALFERAKADEAARGAEAQRKEQERKDREVAAKMFYQQEQLRQMEESRQATERAKAEFDEQQRQASQRAAEAQRQAQQQAEAQRQQMLAQQQRAQAEQNARMQQQIQTLQQMRGAGSYSSPGAAPSVGGLR